MEAKKYPAKDVHRMSGVFFQIGLGLSISIVIVAFEWTTEYTKPRPRATTEWPVDIPLIPVTNPNVPIPPALIKTEIPIARSKVPILANQVLSTTSEPETENQPVIEASELQSQPMFVEIDPIESATEIVTFPQEQAKPVGGYEGFYKMIRDNIKYPKKAQKFDIEGRVFVEFVINRDGSVVDAKVIKGIGYGCDEEAMRVIGLSKWNPGKQRGKPVRVRMVLPIVFTLQ